MSRFPLVESSRASLNRKSESSNSNSINSRPYEFRKRKIYADRQDVKRYRGSSRPKKISDTYRRSKSPDSTRSTSQSRLKNHPSKISRENNFIDTFKPRNPYYSILPLEWWERSEDCKEAKSKHVSKIDRLCKNREFLVLNTTLYKQNIVLEPNMFPYETPEGVLHYTLWSRFDLMHEEVIDFVDNWLTKHMPQVRRWQYDDNCGERSILLYHVHVFIEVEPFSFNPEPGKEYFPPHMSFPETI